MIRISPEIGYTLSTQVLTPKLLSKVQVGSPKSKKKQIPQNPLGIFGVNSHGVPLVSHLLGCRGEARQLRGALPVALRHGFGDRLTGGPHGDDHRLAPEAPCDVNFMSLQQWVEISTL